MTLNNARIQQLIGSHAMTQNQLAQRIGISRGALSNVLSGRRTAGRKTLAGLLRAFPDETLENLTIPNE